MAEIGVQVRMDPAADIAPAAAEGVILREIALRIRIHHAVEEQPVERHLRIACWTVGHIVQLGIVRHQPFEDPALDHHESGRRLGDLDEIVRRDEIGERLRAMTDKVDRVIGVQRFEGLFRGPRGHALLRPVEALDGIDAGRHVVIRQQQTDGRGWTEGEIGIDPEQVRVLLIHQEELDDLVAPPRDETFGAHVQARPQPEPDRLVGELEHAGHVVH